MKGACHCGRTGWTLAAEIDAVTACNCTLCRRYGALWAYGYESAETGLVGQTSSYTRPGKANPSLTIHFCAECGATVGYRAVHLEAGGKRKIAVNVRLAAPEDVLDLRLERFDGLDSFEDLPDDGKRVRDVWF